MKILIVLPAYNEEELIGQNVERVMNFMNKQKGYAWKICVSESRSKDNTVEVLKKISKRYSSKIFSFITSKFGSKSDAIKSAWFSEDADIYMYMDADLSTDLTHIPQLVREIEEGYDIVVGSRGMKSSEVVRSMKRNFISHAYNLITRIFFSLNVHDLQCGFKAVNKKTLNDIVKKTEYMAQGFMDTEILILAAHKKFKIKEIPVKWKDLRISKFNYVKVAMNFVINMIKTKRDLILGRYK